ncbi:MAG: SDR family NAD(P)-dependent oxidoreductase [Nostoc sp.]|uniref:SDR family NAD(P)-dependent oxidoreductase n=1 Tax=Nostoc sp. TaxID=1180 RepID=UPI002FFAE723
MTGKLVNEVAIVTGALSGIDEATAIALSIEGAKIVIAARRSEHLEALAQRIREKDGQVLPIVADISEEAQVQQVIEQIQAKWGNVDILINNAGVMLLGPIEGADTEDWRRMFNLNVLGLLYGIHRVLPIMKAQGGGHIINVSSGTGRIIKGGFAVYCATKWSGIEEHKIWLYDQVTPVHFTLTASIIGELHINQLQQALIRVQQRHALLNVRIVSDLSGQPCLVEDSSSIPLRVVQRQSDQQWQQEVERELSHPFDWNQVPLIRIVLVHTKYISEVLTSTDSIFPKKSTTTTDARLNDTGAS